MLVISSADTWRCVIWPCILHQVIRRLFEVIHCLPIFAALCGVLLTIHRGFQLLCVVIKKLKVEHQQQKTNKHLKKQIKQMRGPARRMTQKDDLADEGAMKNLKRKMTARKRRV